MGKGFRIELDGLQETIARLDKAQQDIIDEIDAAIDSNLVLASRDASRLAPKDFGDLARAIAPKRIKELEYEMVAQKDYAAFVEFGTKGSKSIPPGLEEYAEQFQRKIKRKTSLWAAISAWCKRKKIDEKLWYPIYQSIKKNGTKAHPFFFPAIFKNRPKMISDIKDILNEKR